MSVHRLIVMQEYKMKNTETDQEQIFRLAYEEGMKGIAGQDSTLNTIRQRAISLGGLSSLIATFLGKEALKIEPLNQTVCTWKIIPEWAGIFSLILSILLIIDIIRPINGWIFHNSAKSIIDQFGEGEKAQTIGNTYKILAQFAEDNYLKNEVLLKKLFNKFLIAILIVLIQIICWLLVIQ